MQNCEKRIINNIEYINKKTINYLILKLEVRMNKFRLITLVAVFLAIGALSTFAHDKNYEPILAKPAFHAQPECVGTLPFNQTELYGKNSKNKLQAVEFQVFDSLANTLSYHATSTTPFVWDPNSDILVTVKRGSHNPSDQGVNRNNSKNNLFLRVSNDRGLTWDPNPLLVYDEYADTYGGARYPSMTTFDYNGDFAIAYTCSMVFEAAGTWNGYITGVWGESIGTANIFTPKCTVKGIEYAWGVSDACLTAGTKGGEFYILGAGAVSSPSGDLADNSNIGLRKTVELNPATLSIPDAWNSSKFYDVDTSISRSNELIGFRTREDGMLYMGVFGNFKNEQNIELGKLAFSTSVDGGDTWTEFKIMPVNLFRDYGKTLGLDETTVGVGYQSKDFTVLANGDLYFAVYFSENTESKIWAESIHQILAVKYTAASDSWSLSKISDIHGLWINPIDDNGNTVASYTDLELEVAKTIDESTILVKYCEMQGVQWATDSTYNFQTNDMFITTHKVGTNSWSEPQNITEDAIYQQNTKIPEVVPNNLKGLPVMQTHTILQSGEEPGTSGYPRAGRSYLRYQWVLSGQFDAITGIEDEETISGFAINRIYPNPANESSRIEFSTTGAGNLEIFVTDLLGNRVLDVFSGLTAEGVHSFDLNTSKLMNGSYYVTISTGNKTVTEILTVVK